MLEKWIRKIERLHWGLGAKLSALMAASLFLSSCLSVLIAGYLLQKEFDERSEVGSRIVGHYIDSNITQYVEKTTGAIEALNADSELLRDILSSLRATEQRRVNYLRYFSKIGQLAREYEIDQINIYLKPSQQNQFLLYGIIDSAREKMISFSLKKPGQDPLEVIVDEYGLVNLGEEASRISTFDFPKDFMIQDKRIDIIQKNGQLFLDINFPLSNHIFGSDDSPGEAVYGKGSVYGVLRLFKRLPSTFIEELEKRSGHSLSFYNQSGEYIAGNVVIQDLNTRKTAFLAPSKEGRDYLNYPSIVTVQNLPFAQILVSFDQKVLSQKIFRAILLIFGATFMTSILLVFFLSRYLSKHLAKPIEQMIDFSKRFATGERSAWRDLSQISEDLQNEELGMLHLTFMKMGQEIEDTVNSLEQRVQEETERFMIAKQASISLGSMVAEVAHDVASPSHLIKMEVEDAGPRLVKLKAKVEILFDGVEDPDMCIVRDFFYEQIAALKERMDHIQVAITRIIDIQSAIRNQMRQDLKPEAFSLPALIQETQIILQSKLRGLPLKIEAPEDFMITGIRSQLGQVMTNIIGNAADALREQKYQISEGRPAIIVRAKILLDKSGYLLEIEDDGPGIPPELEKKIFQGHFTTKATGEGTGLGILLSRNIIDKHGAQLHLVAPHDLKGACFQILWPNEGEIKKRFEEAA